jgi:hypothetical protein
MNRIPLTQADVCSIFEPASPSMRCALSRLLFGLMVLTMGTVFFSNPVAAGQVEPPLQALRHPNYSLIVGQRVDRPMTDRRISVQVLERIRGDAEIPHEIEILVLPAEDKLLMPGVPYLLVFTDIERLDAKDKIEVRRPDRRRLLSTEGAAPAVFANTSENRDLLAMEHREVEAGADYRQTIMQQLTTGDPAMADLWSAEMTLRPDTFSQLNACEINTVRSLVENPALRPATRARLLQAAFYRAPSFGRDWYIHSALKVLKETPVKSSTQGNEIGQLIYTALNVARDHPVASAASSIENWLQSTPPLAERAALALRAINPQLEYDAVAAALNQKKTPEATKGMLRDYLKRLQRNSSNK